VMELQYCIVVCNFDLQPNLMQLVRDIMGDVEGDWLCILLCFTMCYCSQLVGCVVLCISVMLVFVDWQWEVVRRV
jgi:hypothetical protein